jgi:hypothetical protein
MASEPEDRKDPKRECVVLSKGCEVVGLGYLRVTGVAAKVTDKRENLANHGQVNRVSTTEQHYLSQVNRVGQNSNTDQQANRVGRVSWVGLATQVSPNSSMDQRTYQVSRVNGLATWSRKRRFHSCC